jgi:glucosamine--fructose-6-phosphate aminotransferase (isomerizing)
MEDSRSFEYRGYDSAGVAVFDGERVRVIKSEGRLANLYQITNQGTEPHGTTGIGHTALVHARRPSDVNSHPTPEETERSPSCTTV